MKNKKEKGEAFNPKPQMANMSAGGDQIQTGQLFYLKIPS